MRRMFLEKKVHGFKKYLEVCLEEGGKGTIKFSFSHVISQIVVGHSSREAM